MEAEDGRGGAEGGAGALEEEAHGAQGKEDRLLAQGEQGSERGVSGVIIVCLLHDVINLE